MRQCEVKSCPNSKDCRNERNRNVRFHRFPSDEFYRTKWEEWVRRMNNDFMYVAEYWSYLCSEHFERDCYNPRKSLRRTAVPSIGCMMKDGKLLGESLSIQEGCNKVPEKEPDLVLFIREEFMRRMSEGQPETCCVPHDTSNPGNCLFDVSNQPSCSKLTQGTSETASVPEYDENDDGTYNCATLGVRKRGRIAYIGDIKFEDFNTPERAAKSFAVIQDQYRRMQNKVHSLTRELRRARAKNVVLLNHLSKHCSQVKPAKA